MNLNVGYMRSTETGYGRMSHLLVEAMKKQGVSVSPCSETENDADFPMHANALWMGSPSHVRGWWEGQRSHVLTMWEGTALPGGFRENMHGFDTVIVPSQQNLELFSQFHPNVKKVGLGIDPNDWHYQDRPEVGTEFRFMCAGQGLRKGIDVAMRAFDTVFGSYVPKANEPIPTLTVKNRTHMKEAKSDRIYEISGTLDAADEIALYANAHCFLGLARGEGWGLMPFQAIAQGCPTILVDAHGQAEFAHLAATRISTTLTKAPSFIFGDAGDWWEPNFDEVCESMWDMYVNYEDYLQPAKFAAAVVAEGYTWDVQAVELVNAIGGPQALTAPDLTTRKWHKCDVQLFRIVANRDCAYEINGVMHTFQKGVEYYELADIKRMMFEADQLDPICLSDLNESGLLPHQQSDSERYKSQHERCYACGQRYNSDMSVDDDDI